MKKSNGGKKVTPKPSPPKFQFSENGASSLVGSIVEKGIQEGPQIRVNAPSSSPNPTVLPFPVARHRSHGPHWGPPPREMRRNVDEDGEEVGDSDKVDQIAAFAGPVKRKEQKGLDFSRWKELRLNDDSSASRERNGDEHISAGCKEKGKASECSQISDEVNCHITRGHKRSQELPPDFNANTAGVTMEEMDTGPLKEIHEKEIGQTRVEMEPGLLDGMNKKRQVDIAKQMMPPSLGVATVTGQDFASLECQIDAENRARLQGMSTSEIAEAQAELMNKMPSALIEVLKNRGCHKSKKQNGSISEMAPKQVSVSPNSMGNGQDSENLDRQIDVENHARLKTMSSDEIAEAQAEILEKMNPDAIEALRKRGHEKSKELQSSVLGNFAEGSISSFQDDERLTKDAKGSPCTESDISNGGSAVASTGEELDHNSMQNLNSGNISYWDTWSKKVEAVRGFRFSLDANILENEFFQVPKTGHVSPQSGYTTNNVAERDFLRTEGDPAAAGYTIKEAVALARSVVPGQRAIALSLLASIADKALQNFCSTQVACNMQKTNFNGFIDWAAVWAYMLGPEPELALSLRMSLDDNHNSVVLASMKVIQCILSCDINEDYFNISERIAPYPKDVCTSPVFRSRPQIDVGFLQGGFWKYNAKPSNIWPFGEDIVSGSETEGEHTIQDDMVVAGQDIVAGLVRMGILPRIRYLLETDPSVTLEECIISILIAVARHSPTCANAIMMCERLVQTVVDRFTSNERLEVNTCKIKSVTLLKVLARSEKKCCLHFIKTGTFRKVTWHLYQYSSLGQWLKLGREKCKLSSELLVEQLRFWKVCIQYGYCVSDFSNLFPALCLWLNVPTFERLVENNVLNEFAAITNEAFLVLGALSQSLPNFYSQMDESDQISEVAAEDTEAWCWVHVSPMVDLALKWIALRSSPFMSEANKNNLLETSSLLWVIAAVLQMLSSVFDRVIPEDATIPCVPWLPEFVPKVGLEIIENGFLSFSRTSATEHSNDPAECDSFTGYLCHLRHHGDMETSIAAVYCLQGFVRVVVSVDQMIHLAKSETHPPPSNNNFTSEAPLILADGIVKSSTLEFRGVLVTLMNFVARDCGWLQSIEVSCRGGPAPGVGVGWGAVEGGYWSKRVLLAQADAGLINLLLENFKTMPTNDLPVGEEMDFAAQRISSALGACLVLSPQSDFIMDKLLDFLLPVPVLKYFDMCIRQLISLDKGIKPLGWYYKEDDFQLFGKILGSHFRSRWLTIKKKKTKATDVNRLVGEKMSKKVGNLDTIHEGLETSSSAIQNRNCTSLAVEWAHQRLPLPAHWFLSPISTINVSKPAKRSSASDEVDHVEDPSVCIEAAKAGLFFLLGIEAISSLLSTEIMSPIRSVPITWKLHSLSVTLLLGMDVLQDERSRDVYESLQSVYGKLLDDSLSGNEQSISEDIDKSLAGTGGKRSTEYLRFQSEIHETYSTFIDTLVEQFSAVSYGDLVYGRQIAIYLHRSVETPARLAAWTALSNAQVLELLPSLENCFARAEGFLEPMEDDEGILEAYAKSWTSGALDRAVTRGSVAYNLVLHHLTSFIFCDHVGDSLSLRNKLARSLLRDFSRKQHHQGMMLDFIKYEKPGQRSSQAAHQSEVERRFKLLTQACSASSLVLEVEKLKLLLEKNV